MGLLTLLYGLGTEGCDMADSQETPVLRTLSKDTSIALPPSMPCVSPLYLRGPLLNGITQLVDSLSRKELFF